MARALSALGSVKSELGEYDEALAVEVTRHRYTWGCLPFEGVGTFDFYR